MRHLLPFKYVEAIAKAGSIRKAAEQLSITPSALNRRLLSIEEELGVAIFERLAVGVRLNTAGELLLEHIRNQVSDLERVKSQISDLSGVRRGHVSIAASPELAGQFLVREVAAYQAAFPGVTFSVRRAFRGEAEQSLIEHEADLAIVFEPVRLADFQTVFSFQQPLMCRMPKTHPLAGRSELRLYECAEFPMLLPRSNWGLRHIVDQSALRLGLQLQVMAETDSASFLDRWYRQSDALSFDIPINLVTTWANDVTAVKVSPLDVPEGFAFVGHLRGRTLPVAAARFMEQVTTNLAKIGELPQP